MKYYFQSSDDSLIEGICHSHYSYCQHTRNSWVYLCISNLCIIVYLLLHNTAANKVSAFLPVKLIWFKWILIRIFFRYPFSIEIIWCSDRRKHICTLNLLNQRTILIWLVYFPIQGFFITLFALSLISESLIIKFSHFFCFFLSFYNQVKHSVFRKLIR